MSYYRYGGYPRYSTPKPDKEKNRLAVEKLKKKQPDISPVTVTGRKLAKTWWGMAWINNLERYSDYSNRLGRGSSYVRNGSVLDLKISSGLITSLVQGTRAKPYKVNISIKPLDKKTWRSIVDACEGKIESLQELVDGKFPEALAELFTAKGDGLFPTPREIEFDCDCPDWASMCKHVAATLYGAGTRLDEDPGLFFLLRDVRIEEMISKAVEQRSDQMLKKADKKTKRVIEDEDLSDVFGIDVK